MIPTKNEVLKKLNVFQKYFTPLMHPLRVNNKIKR